VKVKVIGRNKPFWDGQLREIGDVVDVPNKIMDSKNPPRWAKPVRAKKADSKPEASDLLT